jgi:tetratricopeptide (TPR) repeat protein
MATHFSLEEPSSPLWCVPFDHLQEFVGRRNEIKTLETKLFQPNGCGGVAVLGLGGVGKSRIALELAHRTKAQRPKHSVFWVQATDSLTFEKDVYEIGKKLEIQGIEDGKADVKNLVKQRLSHESAGQWLMILDNADDEAIWGTKSTLTDYLPNSPMGSVLVTTRNRRVATNLTGKESIELQEMKEVEALDTFRSLLAKPDILADLDATSTLLERLTYLPLAIVQAAAYINMNDVSILVYLDLLNDSEENVIELLSEDFQTKGRYKDGENPVAVTWLISFEQILRQNPLAADYLSFISCLSEKNIPQSLLPDAPSTKKMIDALGVIKAYFFLWKRNNSDVLDPLYDMHRLVRLATRSWLKSQDSLVKWTETAIKRLAELFPICQHKNKDQWILYMPHTRILCDSNLGIDLIERYALLEKMGSWLVLDGKYEEAVRIQSSVVLWREQKLGEMDKRTWEAYDSLGEALRERGDWNKAEKYHKQAFDGQRAKLGPEHPSTLTSMANLASTFWNQGRWKEAEELEVQVMETRKRVLRAEHPDTLTSMANLASTFWNQGRWKEAEELQVQVMETSSRVLRAEHPDTLISMANLASTYRNQGRWKEAEELQVQVMETRKRVLRAEHPDTLISMANLALTYMNQGRWKEAEELQVQVMETSSRVLGAEHPSTLTGMANLASTFWNQGRWKEAEELEVQVMETSSRVLGAEHPDTLTGMANLAFTLKSQSRNEEAISLIKNCFQLRKQILGPQHPDTESSLKALNEWADEDMKA